MRYLLLLVACLPVILLAQKSTAIRYPGRCTVDLYKNGQVVTCQNKGVRTADTLYNADSDYRLSFSGTSTTIDHNGVSLPARKR